ncbi:MAG: DUF2723 domain-containing protein [Mariniphaga sp.]|nr:DUF2723 domain-containing protein [Mariniphaga sp.]
MKKFNSINNILGWVTFLISAIVYLLTIEPTVSWWDCGEFITSAYKLEVGHPPGAPFFMIVGRFFSLFAPDSSKVALMLNSFSALASAATIMFLYWTIVHLAKKLFPSKDLSLAEKIIIWGSGLVGALAFTFTDSFWFSAVEGEVYAFSSFFTAIVFWAILKWENVADQPNSNRWIILIAYLVGLSIGVHLLNLLAIPAIAYVYYFRKYKFSWKGVISAGIISIGILGGIQYIIIPGVATVAFWFDKFFVNTIGLPFNTGVIIYVAAIIAGSAWAIRYTHKTNKPLLNTVIVSVLVILIGYSSYGVILLRASANTPMNQNHPDNAYGLLYYLNREQYGDRPLVHGHYYSAPSQGVKGEKAIYNKVDGKYVNTSTTPKKTVYDSRFTTFFPRMYSTNPDHIQVYEDWGKVKGTRLRVNQRGEASTVVKPRFSENLRFFFSYQIGHMYLRYFMWNFAGKQNDIQSNGTFKNGNWISGINFLDKGKIGPIEKLPEFMKDLPTNNKYYLLPLLFGIIGLVYQYNRGSSGKKNFAITALLFFFTGIAIIMYLNQYPMQPRERDYAYTGSYYAFAIWIGLAVPALFAALKKISGSPVMAGAVVAVSLALVPGILASENWDDHDRSGRYMARDIARNYLESCAQNAILFTYGDNDTFPLWYVQEVEGVRPDIRIVNLSYLGMDWYVNQQTYAQNEAAPMPFSFTRDKYYQGVRDAVIINDRNVGRIDLVEAMDLVQSEDVRSKVRMANNEMMDFIPTKDFYVNVDKNKVLTNGTVKPEDADLIADRVEFSITKPYIVQSEWVILNLIAANNWERPIYFDHSLIFTGNIFVTDWLQFEGLAYRLVPIKQRNPDVFKGRIDSEILYNNVMNKFTWGNIDDPDVFLDDYNQKSLKITQSRYMYARLAEQLILEGKNETAIVVLDRMFELFPGDRMYLTFDSFPAVQQYYAAGANEKGNNLVRELAKNCFAELEYYLSLPDQMANSISQDQNQLISFLRNLVIITQQFNQTELNTELDLQVQELITRLSS